MRILEWPKLEIFGQLALLNFSHACSFKTLGLHQLTPAGLYAQSTCSGTTSCAPHAERQSPCWFKSLRWEIKRGC